jgi:hypothetical protein
MLAAVSGLRRPPHLRRPAHRPPERPSWPPPPLSARLCAVRWGKPLTKRERQIVARTLVGLYLLAAGYLYVLNAVVWLTNH